MNDRNTIETLTECPSCGVYSLPGECNCEPVFVKEEEVKTKPATDFLTQIMQT